APNERKVRIEVGYGLEGVLTDALTRVIIETSILPHFRAGDMAAGVAEGAKDIVAVLSGAGEEVAQRMVAPPSASDDVFDTIFPILIFIMIVIVIVIIIRNGGTGSGSGGWSSSSSSGSSWGSSSGSSGGFSGGGGSFGGGGSSGSW
ncbi:MAG TPA: TPM domain-containing protein, partial [Hyphomicrobiales bacterium]|nr:TPM domain-containing protein [Hyphomicrobiales bacterium]